MNPSLPPRPAALRSAGLLLALLLLAAPALAQASLPLTGEHVLTRDTRYTSASGQYVVFQGDGNLVVYTAAGQPTWALQTVGVDYRRVGRVVMQADGNLAAYAADGAYLWSALTANPDPAARLQISPAGALQLVSSGRGVLWSSDGDLSSAPAQASGGSAAASPGTWRVHEGTTARHSFGRTVANGDNEGFLSGARIPAAIGSGWSSASTDLSLQWGGPGGTPCRSQANYTYFETVVQPANGGGYEIEFMSVDDVARVSVMSGTSTINIPETVGLRERKTITLTPFLVAGAANRVVITLADVCGSGNGIRAVLRPVAGAAASEPSEGTMTIEGTVVRTGALQYTLEWAGPADLDLGVADPQGAKVNWQAKTSASGGLLDVDARADCSGPGGASDKHVENILWQSAPPAGEYHVGVHHYAVCGTTGPVPYTVTVRRDGQVVAGPWSGTVNPGMEAEHTHTSR